MTFTHISFIRPAPPLKGWRLALLATGLAALIPSTVRWLQQAEAIERLETQIAQVQPRRVPQPALTAIQQREQEQQVKIIADAVRQLNLPVARLLKTLQAPGDMHVALLGLDLNGQSVQEAGGTSPGAAMPGAGPQGAASNAPPAGGADGTGSAGTMAAAYAPSGSLKIAAEAETAQDMLNYLAFLGQQQMFRSVYLVKHETAGGAAGQAYRFQLEAQWRL